MGVGGQVLRKGSGLRWEVAITTGKGKVKGSWTPLPQDNCYFQKMLSRDHEDKQSIKKCLIGTNGLLIYRYIYI